MHKPTLNAESILYIYPPWLSVSPLNPLEGVAMEILTCLPGVGARCLCMWCMQALEAEAHVGCVCHDAATLGRLREQVVALALLVSS